MSDLLRELEESYVRFPWQKAVRLAALEYELALLRQSIDEETDPKRRYEFQAEYADLADERYATLEAADGGEDRP